ncbi:type II secretion system minor pseudopilin GspK [Ramlibacter sp.]|uniref:type II secretion system minor pseudopilin GspK n=1 Tax=Ramlibacter sp. TaxID=1917967 RepID=UPI003D123CA0
MRRGTRAQAGAALLSAMLVVTLVATFASAALWQQWRSVEVERSERTRVQSGWILTGALDWGRLILREDARSGGADHLAEPWAVPLQEARLSTFLAADAANNADTADAGRAFLSGQITDLQSLMNVTNLVQAGRLSDEDFASFARLFDLLGLPQALLARMAENLRFASDISMDNRSASQAALYPQRVEQLVWLGLPAQAVAVLQPYVTVLPQRTTLNVNTASAEAIFAVVGTITLADAQRLVAERQRTHFGTIGQAMGVVGSDATANGRIGVTTRYFEIRGRLRLDDSIVEERSIVQRDGLEVRVVQRERGVVDPDALALAPPVPR